MMTDYKELMDKVNELSNEIKKLKEVNEQLISEVVHLHTLFK